MGRLPDDSRGKGTKARSIARRLRSEMSQSEVIVWSRLKGGQIGFEFRRQHPVLGYFLDFYCPAAKLGLEVDGEQHDPNQDAARDQLLNQIGIRLLRISSFDVFEEKKLDEWIELIWSVCSERT